MFGLGAWEIMLIVVVALVFLGPAKMPEIARQIGKVVRDLNRAADDFRREITNPALHLLDDDESDGDGKAVPTPAAPGEPTQPSAPDAGSGPPPGYPPAAAGEHGVASRDAVLQDSGDYGDDGYDNVIVGAGAAGGHRPGQASGDPEPDASEPPARSLRASVGGEAAYARVAREEMEAEGANPPSGAGAPVEATVWPRRGGGSLERGDGPAPRPARHGLEDDPYYRVAVRDDVSFADASSTAPAPANEGAGEE